MPLFAKINFTKEADWLPISDKNGRFFKLIDDAINRKEMIQIECDGNWKSVTPFSWASSKENNMTFKAYSGSGADGAVRAYRIDKVTNVRPNNNADGYQGKYNQNKEPENEWDDLQQEYDKNYNKSASVESRLIKKQ